MLPTISIHFPIDFLSRVW